MTLNHTTSNKRFICYVVLLYVLALTASSWVPETSPIFAAAPFIKLALVPLPMALLIAGAKKRWPNQFFKIAVSSCCFYTGLIGSTILTGF